MGVYELLKETRSKSVIDVLDVILDIILVLYDYMNK